MKQAKNEVFIEGILSESTIKAETSKDGKPYIRGEVKILVNQTIDKEVVESLIPVRMFAMKFKKDGGLNKAYEAIQTVKDEFVSIASAGNVNDADCVRITRGTINENLFIPRDSDKEISFPEIQANFITKINKATLRPLTKFSVNIAVNGIKEDVKKNGELTGALLIKGGIVQYNDKLDLVDFKVYKENAKSHIEQHWNKGDTVNVQGYINFSSTTDYVEEESGFGDVIAIPKTSTVRELIVVSGSPEGFEEENAYTKADLNSGLDQRLARLEVMKQPKVVAQGTGGF